MHHRSPSSTLYLDSYNSLYGQLRFADAYKANQCRVKNYLVVLFLWDHQLSKLDLFLRADRMLPMFPHYLSINILITHCKYESYLSSISKAIGLLGNLGPLKVLNNNTPLKRCDTCTTFMPHGTLTRCCMETCRRAFHVNQHNKLSLFTTPLVFLSLSLLFGASPFAPFHL